MFDELLKSIYQYLNGIWTLQLLQEWLLSNLQDILNSGDNYATDIANEIDADLIQISEGLIDEADIQDRLASYAMRLETIHLVYKKKSPVTHTDSYVAETVREKVENLGSVEDLHLSHVFALPAAHK